MMNFLDELCKKYPNKISYEYIGKSQKEKQIPMVYLGENKVDNFKVCFMVADELYEIVITEIFIFYLEMKFQYLLQGTSGL